MTRCLLGLLPGLALIGTMLQAEWEDYKPVSLSDAWARTGVVTEPGASAPSYSLVGAPGLYKFRVKATYTSEQAAEAYRLLYARHLGASAPQQAGAA